MHSYRILARDLEMVLGSLDQLLVDGKIRGYGYTPVNGLVYEIRIAYKEAL